MFHPRVKFILFKKKFHQMQLSVEYQNQNGNDIELCLTMKLGTLGCLVTFIPGKCSNSNDTVLLL